MPKPSTFNIEEHGDGIHEYGPTTGIPELREKVAAYCAYLSVISTLSYQCLTSWLASLITDNTTFREGMSKKLGPENICIVPGGRTGLSRLMSVMTPILLGYQVPDYAAYEPLLSHSHVQAIPMQLSEDDNYKLTPAMLRKEIRDRGLSAVLMSNPRNPTGQLIEGEELKEVVDLAQECNVTMILDEFYSWYLHQGELGRSVSSMSYIQDPNDSNVAIIDGLTKVSVMSRAARVNHMLKFRTPNRTGAALAGVSAGSLAQRTSSLPSVKLALISMVARLTPCRCWLFRCSTLSASSR